MARETYGLLLFTVKTSVASKINGSADLQTTGQVHQSIVVLSQPT